MNVNVEIVDFFTTLFYFSNNLLWLQNGGKNRKVCFYVTNIQESVKGLGKYYKSEFIQLCWLRYQFFSSY